MKHATSCWLIGLFVLAVTIPGSRSREVAPAQRDAAAKKSVEIAGPAESAVDIRKNAKHRYETGSVRDAETGKLFQKAADMGDPLAVMWVARLHKRGFVGFSQDKIRAMELAKTVIADVQRMAKAGDSEAQFLLGSALSEELALPKDEPMAFTWVKKSAESGNVLAQGTLATYYHWGLGIDADLQKAWEWYNTARRAGVNAAGDMRLLEPCWAEHPFKANAILAMPYAKLFGLLPEEFMKAAVTSEVIAATAKAEEEPEVGGLPGYKCMAEGIRFGMRFGRLRSVELYAKGAKGHDQFKGTLPLDLAWDDTRETVRKKLGPPDDSGGVSADSAYGMAYIIENLTLAVMFSYDQEKHIKLVRIYEKWPRDAKGVPRRDAAQPGRPAHGVVSDTD